MADVRGVTSFRMSDRFVQDLGWAKRYRRKVASKAFWLV